ncbi:MAG: PQQ-dependent sugar dehydrogenase [Saprospiraceae bacterium]|nr:PQQ-dependent sugar dehydrogenase [Saprospiraceae bacterium]
MKAQFMFAFFMLSQTLIFGQSNLSTRTVAKGLDTPWEIIWGVDNQIWVTERYGRISRVNPTTGVISPLLTISEVRETGEAGLLGMAVETDVSSRQPYVFVAYTYTAAGNNFRKKVVRYQFSGSTLTNPTTILDNITAANIHNGCRLLITPDKKLLITTGDVAVTSTSQTLSNLNGKILRLNFDGTIPDDNPIKGSSVWTWGHRNAQGLVYSSAFKQFYSSEHGASTNDELNVIQKGRNYGWPRVEGLCDQSGEQTFCRDSNVVEPINAWTPTLGVSGVDFYSQNLISEWKNCVLMTSLSGRRLTVVKLNTDGTRMTSKTDYFTDVFGRLRDVCISPDGKVYIAVSNRDGRGSPTTDDDRIIEISPKTATNVSEEYIFFRSFPNPTSDELTIECSKKIGKILLFDIQGAFTFYKKEVKQTRYGAKY